MRYIKCKVCKARFYPSAEHRYTSRDMSSTGISNIMHQDEVELYDSFDCPICGCQMIVQKRKREYRAAELEEGQDDES